MTYQKYKFRPYNKEYPILFAKEKKKLIKLLQKAEIEHVGSTAVLGLGGKGIIDIAIKTPQNKLKNYTTKLESAGFEYNPNHPRDNRRVFMQKVVIYESKERILHVHLCLTKKFFDSFIVFRNYLRKNKKERNEYARIKREAVKHAKGKGKKYQDYKDEFIRDLMRKALGELK